MAEQVKCPLCENKMSLRGLQKHLASHQQQLALFALPPTLEDTEADDDSATDAPANVTNGHGDTSESEASVESDGDNDKQGTGIEEDSDEEGARLFQERDDEVAQQQPSEVTFDEALGYINTIKVRRRKFLMTQCMLDRLVFLLESLDMSSQAI